MSEQTWRPLGVDDEDSIAEYDALHDAVPSWMWAAYWAWVRDAIIASRRTTPNQFGSTYNIEMLDEELVERMSQALKISLPNLREERVNLDAGKKQLAGAMHVLSKHQAPLQVADYLLGHGGHARAETLSELLERSKSAFQVGTRSGLPGLVRRVPLGVQVAADDVMARAGRAGIRLAKAWEALYGLTPDPSTSYSLAIKAVEDAAIPVVSPTNTRATLGTVIQQMTDQGDWTMPMLKEHTKAAPGDVLVSNMRMLWHGQHDRHGGQPDQPSAPGNVSAEEAAVAVGLAVTLVSWFDAGLVARATP